MGNSDSERLEAALAELGGDHPWAVALGEAKCGRHVISQALAHQNMHIANIEKKILRDYCSRHGIRTASVTCGRHGEKSLEINEI